MIYVPLKASADPDIYEALSIYFQCYWQCANTLLCMYSEGAVHVAKLTTLHCH